MRHDRRPVLLRIGVTVRHRGYAKAMLAAALPYCRALGLTQVLITCDEGNIASEKTIVSCGGVYENTRTQSDGTRIKRFWIHLQKHPNGLYYIH